MFKTIFEQKFTRLFAHDSLFMSGCQEGAEHESQQVFFGAFFWFLHGSQISFWVTGGQKLCSLTGSDKKHQWVEGALVRGFLIVIGRRSRVLKSDRKVDGAARGGEKGRQHW